MGKPYRTSKNNRERPSFLSKIFGGQKATRKRDEDNIKPGTPNMILLVLFIGIIIFGLLMVFNTSFYLHGWDRFNKQIIWLGISIVIAIPLYLIDYRKLKYFAVPGIIITIILLFVAIVTGPEINGTRQWIVLIPGYMQVQPAEIAKFTLVLYLASWLSKTKHEFKTLEETIKFSFGRELVSFIVILGLIGGLIVVSKDLGTTIVLFVTAFTVYFVSGTDFIHTLGSVAIGATAALMGILAVVIEPFRINRVQTFINLLLKGEITDPRVTGYQISQILIGIGGTGGPDGTGFGHSRQRLGYLVEDTAFTDSIGAVIIEELGFFKGVIFVFIYVFMLYLCFRVALQAKDRFGQLLAAGLSTWLAVQFCVHMGVNLVLLPLTGLTLPFISYGGSSIIVTVAAMAVIFNISRYNVGTESNARRNKA